MPLWGKTQEGINQTLRLIKKPKNEYSATDEIQILYFWPHFLFFFACFNRYPSPLAVVLCSLFFPFILSSIKVPCGEKKHSHHRACVLFAAITLLSCLVCAFSFSPGLSWVFSLRHLALTEHRCTSMLSSGAPQDFCCSHRNWRVNWYLASSNLEHSDSCLYGIGGN